MRLPTCTYCHDIGVWILPSGTVSVCPSVQTMREHNAPGDAARVLVRCVERLVREGKSVNAHLFGIARHLSSGTSHAPVERAALLEKHFNFTRQQLRSFHHAIEELRRVWALPVGSRKDAPAGYWIITEQVDFAEWVKRSKAAPIKQLTTIFHVARVNWPWYAEQLELEFWGDVGPQPNGASVRPNTVSAAAV